MVDAGSFPPLFFDFFGGGFNAPSRELLGSTDQRRRFKVLVDRAWKEGRLRGSRVAEGYIQDLQAAFALVTQPSVIS